MKHTLAGCGGGGGSGARTVGQVSDEVTRWLSRARPVTEVPPQQRAIRIGRDTSNVTSLDELIRSAPTEQSDEVGRQLARLRALAEFQESVQATGRSIDDRWSMINTDVAFIAAEASQGANRSNLDYMTTIGKQLLRDTVCEITWTQLTDKEKSAILGLIRSGEYTTRNTGTVRGLGSMTQKAALEAIRDQAIKLFLSQFIHARIADWNVYSYGILKKAGELTADSNETLRHPDTTVTTALIHHARICLRPPR